MTLNTLKCNRLMPLPFKGLNSATELHPQRATVNVLNLRR